MERKDNDFEDYFTEDEVKEILATEIKEKTEIRGKPLFDQKTVDDVLKDYGSEIAGWEFTHILHKMGDRMNAEMKDSIWKSYQAYRELFYREEEAKLKARREKVDKVVDFFKDVGSEIDVYKQYVILQTRGALQAGNLPRKLIFGVLLLSTIFLGKKYLSEVLDNNAPQSVYGGAVVIESYRPPESFLDSLIEIHMNQPFIKPEDYFKRRPRPAYLTEGTLD
tara:strand:- start:6717 stop:7382 length:666 start_codon:yes stop_codon:yes gene_type:complete